MAISHHYQAGKIEDFAVMPTRPRLEGKKLPCQRGQNGYILYFMDWATINNSPKRQRPSPQTVFNSGEQPPFNTDVKNGRFEHVLPRLVCLEQTGFAKDIPLTTCWVFQMCWELQGVRLMDLPRLLSFRWSYLP